MFRLQLYLLSDFAETVIRPNQALKVTTTAVKFAYKKPGVSVLSTPTDILTEKLDGTLKKAFSSNKPTIIDIVIDPEKLAASTKKTD